MMDVQEVDAQEVVRLIADFFAKHEDDDLANLVSGSKSLTSEDLQAAVLALLKKEDPLHW